MHEPVPNPPPFSSITSIEHIIHDGDMLKLEIDEKKGGDCG